MKVFLLFTLLMASGPGIAFGGPFLVCDPPDPAEQVEYYLVYKDGTQLGGRIDAQSDGSLLLDISDIPPGQYVWTAKAGNAWGESDFSAPYTSPSASTAPEGLDMVP